MAFDRHALFGGGLVAVILAAVIAGITITGGPGEARKEKEDAARTDALARTALALACAHQQASGTPESVSGFETDKADPFLNGCANAAPEKDPVSGAEFPVRRQDGKVTHICAEFATGADGNQIVYDAYWMRVVPELNAPRETGGEHCFEVNLNAELN
jgi:hypothetical protein